MNSTNVTAAMNSTTSPDSSTILFGTTGDTALSGVKVFFALGGLALNAILQRSGADEFPCPTSISLARSSPLICAADMLVALVTLVYGFCKGIGFQQSCTLYIRNTRRHHAAQLPPLEMTRLFIDFFFSIPAILGAVIIFAAKGIDIRITIWAAMFTTAPVVSAMLRMVAANELAQREVNTFLQAGLGRSLLQLSDLIWCAAYACQFTLWIQVFEAFSVVPRFGGSSGKWMNIAIASSILVAVVLSTIFKGRFYEYWSLRTWKRREWFVAANVGFVLVLVVGMPTDAESIAKWRRTLFVPLGALSVVVNMLWIVTLLEDLLAYFSEAIRTGSWTGVPARVLEGDVPEVFEERINPLLSTTPEFWRRTLMLNFACCQIIFAAFNFIVAEDASSFGKLPSWASIFG